MHGVKDYKLAADGFEEFAVKTEKKSKRKSRETDTENLNQVNKTAERDIDYSNLNEIQQKNMCGSGERKFNCR